MLEKSTHDENTFIVNKPESTKIYRYVFGSVLMDLMSVEKVMIAYYKRKILEDLVTPSASLKSFKNKSKWLCCNTKRKEIKLVIKYGVDDVAAEDSVTKAIVKQLNWTLALAEKMRRNIHSESI